MNQIIYEWLILDKCKWVKLSNTFQLKNILYMHYTECYEVRVSQWQSCISFGSTAVHQGVREGTMGN